MCMQDAITVDYVNPELTLEHGWVYSPTGNSGTDYPSCTRERSGLQPPPDYLYQLYQKADPKFTGTITVPVLWVSRAGFWQINMLILTMRQCTCTWSNLA